jgi:hypothetical protein
MGGIPNDKLYCAYMLVYEQQNEIEDLFRSVDDSNMP